jgi:hypothetical protein
MSDYITATDPIIGWEAIRPAHIIEVNPYDAMIETAWQKRDADIDKAFEAGSLDLEICEQWTQAIDYLRYLQDVWTVNNTACECSHNEYRCYSCQARVRLTYKL